MYSSIEEFIGDYTRERESTLKIMKALNDTSLAQRATPESRPLGRMAWHVVTAVGELPAATVRDIAQSRSLVEPAASPARPVSEPKNR